MKRKIAETTPRRKPIDVVLDSMKRALSPIPFWVAYKRECYWHHELTEGAIVGEFRDTLSGAVRWPATVHCEVEYSVLKGHGPLKTMKGKDRADFAIRDCETGAYLAAIEVKRGDTISKVCKEDLEALHLLQAANPSIRKFFVLVSEAGRPNQLITEAGHGRRKLSVEGVQASLTVRRVCRAVGTAPRAVGDRKSVKKKRSPSTHYAVLLEIDAPEG